MDPPANDYGGALRQDGRGADLRDQLALVPIVGMAGATGVGAVALVILQLLELDGAPPAVPMTLMATFVALLLCERWARRRPQAAAQLAAGVVILATLVMMHLAPVNGVAIGTLSVGAGTVVGTLSAPPGAWRWGGVSSVLWMVAISTVGIPLPELASLLVFPPVLFVALSLLLARVTLGLHDSHEAVQLSLRGLSVVNERLEGERVRAETANQAKSTFLTSMSHELRTPLNAIIGYAELILDDPEAVEVDDVRRIERSGRHLLALVNDVLDMSRIEGGALEIAWGTVPVRHLLDEIRDVARGLAAEQRNELRWDVAADVPDAIAGDALRMRQVVLNLVGNALKFTHDGVVTVSAATSGELLQVRVSDTGPGIEDDLLPRLFQPFAQGRSDKIKHQGTGLGLAISRSLARAMGGRILVQSELGVGSRFTLVLPLEESPTASGVHELLPLRAEAF